MKLCPHCQQPLPELRQGIKLSPLKARIFDMVKRSQHNGVTIEDITGVCFNGHAKPVTVRMHIHQINEALAETGLRICGDTPGMYGFYHVAPIC